MKRNIVFDNGNVLVMYEPLQVLRRFLSDEQDVETLDREFYRAGYIRHTDRGVMTHEEAIEQVKDRLPARLVELLRYLYIDHLYGRDFMPVFPAMTELVREVKEKGYGAYMLSNAGFDFYDYSPHIPAIAMMDGAVPRAFRPVRARPRGLRVHRRHAGEYRRREGRRHGRDLLFAVARGRIRAARKAARVRLRAVTRETRTGGDYG